MIEQSHVLQLLSMIRPQRCGLAKIRIGNPYDGGYVVNDDFAGRRGVVSIGVGWDDSFDHFFAARDVPVFQYDHTVAGTPHPHEKIAFREVAWGTADGEGTRTLDGMLRENGIDGCPDLLLKFDVEGAEYDCLPQASSATLACFRVIVGEFHACANLADPVQFERMLRCFGLLNATHAVTHLHANNFGTVRQVHGVPVPETLEISFLRRDRSHFSPGADPIPGMLDKPNNPRSPDIVLTPFG